MSGVRKRPLAENTAKLFKAYLEGQMMVNKTANAEICLLRDGVVSGKRNEISVEDIQNVSVDKNASLQVRFIDAKGAAFRLLRYDGDNPYAVSIADERSGESELYVDDLYDMAVRQVQAQKQKSKQSQEEHVTQLVGVSKNSLRFRTDDAGNKWVNVAVPWAQSKNGLGNLDIPMADFQAANTAEDMKKRSTYHIPLKSDTYGLWFIDKATGQPTKPSVPTSKIYQAYESNRSAYRNSRITSQTKEEEAQLETSTTPDVSDFAVDDFDFD